MNRSKSLRGLSLTILVTALGCVSIPDMQGGASTITGTFTPEEAKGLMAQKKVLPASRLTTKTTRNATTNRSSSRIVHQRHFLTQKGYLYPPVKFMPLLRVEGIATDLVLGTEAPHYVPIYVGSLVASVSGLSIATVGTINEVDTLKWAGQGLMVAGVAGSLWSMYVGILDTHTITRNRKGWANQWNQGLAEKLGLQYDPESIQTVVFIGNRPLDE